jgi:chemotaxis family two-component system response regulator Rcp1
LNSLSETRIFEILMVEDNLGDVLLMTEAFQESRLPAHLSVVGDGEEALDFLGQRGKYHQAPKPDFILLDLNLPRMDGRAFLRRVRREGPYPEMPVVVLTTSRLRSDMREVWDLSVNAYIVKPADLAGFQQTIRSLQDFWKTTIQFAVRPEDIP